MTIVILMLKKKYMNKDQLNKLPILKKIAKFSVTDVSMDFDETSLYPSAIWVEKLFYLKPETGFAFSLVTNEEIVEKFKTQTFTKCSAILKELQYKSSDSIIQHLPVKETVRKTEIKR